jgi:hypothetical protein
VRKKRDRGGAVSIVALACVVVTMFATAAFVATNKEAFPTWWNGAVRQTALTGAQRADVMRLLNKTDDLDRIFNGKGAAKEFAYRLAEIEREALALDSSLPRGDAATDLTVNAIKAYQEAAMMWTSGKRPRDSEEVAAQILAAGMRKGLARKVIQGVLSEQEKRLLREWQAGQQGS